jgi:hypothetical protein
MDPGSQHNFCFVATDSPRDTTNRNQPLSFFHMDPTNTTEWARKSFIGSVVSCRVDFGHYLFGSGFFGFWVLGKKEFPRTLCYKVF